MASEWRQLKLEVLAETKEFIKGMDKANASTKTLGDKLADFGKKAAIALAAAGAAAIAFATKAVLMAEKADTANKRIQQINESMGLFGDSTNQVTKRLVEYAEATARATGIDTNSIKATQAKLLTFKELAKTANEVGGEFDRATQAAIDLASAGFGSAETNAVQLGKALQDPIKGLTALSRSGVTFTETEKERIKVLVESNKIGEAQKLILAAIETQVGGTALATANSSDKMKVAFTQIQEQIGLALLPTFNKMSDWFLKTAVPAIQAFVDGLAGQKGATVAITDANKAAFEFGNKVATVAKRIYDLKEELFTLGSIIASVFIATKVTAFVTAIQGLVTAFLAWRSAAAGAAIATAAATGGVSSIAAIAGVSALVASLTGAFLLFKSPGDSGGGGSTATGPLGNYQMSTGQTLGGGSTLIPSGVSGGYTTSGGTTLGGLAGTTGKSLGGFASVGELTDRLMAIQDEIGALTFKYQTGQISKSQAQSALNKLKTEMASIENIAGNLAQTIPTPGLESISGATQRGEYSGNITVIVQAPSVIDETGFTRAVVDALNSVERRQGGGASALVGL